MRLLPLLRARTLDILLCKASLNTTRRKVPCLKTRHKANRPAEAPVPSLTPPLLNLLAYLHSPWVYRCNLLPLRNLALNHKY